MREIAMPWNDSSGNGANADASPDIGRVAALTAWGYWIKFAPAISLALSDLQVDGTAAGD
jgi:hypothetical protein